MTQNYIAVIHKDADSDYGVSFPDLPGCVSAGTTLDEARDMAAEALADHLELLAESGEAIPEPSDLETVMKDPDFRDGVAILVPAPSSETRRVRINVSFSERDLEVVDSVARSYDMTRSALLAYAARELAGEDDVRLRA